MVSRLFVQAQCQRITAALASCFVPSHVEVSMLNVLEILHRPFCHPGLLERNSRRTYVLLALQAERRRSCIPKATKGQVHAQVVVVERCELVHLCLVPLQRLMVYVHAVGRRASLIEGRRNVAILPAPSILLPKQQQVDEALPADILQVHEYARAVAERRGQRVRPRPRRQAVVLRSEAQPADGKTQDEALEEQHPLVVQKALLRPELHPHRAREILGEERLVHQDDVVLHVRGQRRNESGSVEGMPLLPRT
mmetsp:Transcript_121158/g.354066  ORF Transcript_121158/g.354066 Transcript_121158/m.354066 type:complete len:252 (+) Transcript_121158:1647-2402(+)